MTEAYIRPIRSVKNKRPLPTTIIAETAARLSRNQRGGSPALGGAPKARRENRRGATTF